MIDDDLSLSRDFNLIMKLILLTHEREFDRITNTGALVQRRFPHLCQRVLWQRKEPNQAMLELIESGKVGLVYPSTESAGLKVTSGTALSHELPEYMILLDATWQEAAKMYRQSPYLQNLPTYHLEQAPQTLYVRRRNQKQGGLCTLECAAVLYELAGDAENATQLLGDLKAHNLKQFDTCG
nr:tRNA-uridine aminocarboxypropyltransferase [Shewanella corallii]